MPPRKPALGFILITVALDVLGFGLLIPVAPRLVMSLLSGGHGTEAQAAPYVSGLQSTFFAMSFLFAPLLGILSDKVGRRPVLLVALFGSALDYLAMSMAPTLGILFITRVINGLSGASQTVASAYIADVTPREKRAAAFGMMGAAFGIGFIIGPLIGGLLGDDSIHIPLIGQGNIRYPFYAAAGLTIINWFYGLLVLPESLPKERRNTFNWKRANPLGALHGLGRYPLVAGLAAALFLSFMAQFGLHSTWVLYTSFRYAWTPKDVAFSLFLVGVGAAIVQGGLARKLIPFFGEKRSMLIGLTTSALAFAGYGLATHGWMIYAILAVASFGAIGQPAGQALITHTVRPDEQGAIQGTLTSLNSIAGIIGPLLGGWAFKIAISDNPPFHLPGDNMNAGAPFFVGSFLSIIAIGVAAWALKKHRHEAHIQLGDKCLKCGYDLKGLAPPMCPECGTPVPPKAAAAHTA
jgi:DHA1 family tetracycline resistance protein-like MFS transporter